MLGSVAKAESLIGHCESEAEEEDDDEDDDALKIDTEDSLHLDLLGLGNDEDYGPTSPFCKRQSELSPRLRTATANAMHRELQVEALRESRKSLHALTKAQEYEIQQLRGDKRALQDELLILTRQLIAYSKSSPPNRSSGGERSTCCRCNDTLACSCPITQEPLVDPVVAADGVTYERSAIEHWLQNSWRSPATGVTLNTRALYPNFTLRGLLTQAPGIQHQDFRGEFKESHSEEDEKDANTDNENYGPRYRRSYYDQRRSDDATNESDEEEVEAGGGRGRSVSHETDLRSFDDASLDAASLESSTVSSGHRDEPTRGSEEWDLEQDSEYTTEASGTEAGWGEGFNDGDAGSAHEAESRQNTGEQSVRQRPSGSRFLIVRPRVRQSRRLHPIHERLSSTEAGGSTETPGLRNLHEGTDRPDAPRGCEGERNGARLAANAGVASSACAVM